MANRNTRRLRPLRGYKVRTGKNVDTHAERKMRGRDAYRAPTLYEHPISHLGPIDMRRYAQ